MLKGFSNITLLAILAVLVGIYLLINFTGGKQRSKSFKSELVKIDTSAVNKIEIEKNNEKLLIKKESNQWKVRLKSGEEVKAKASNVKSTLTSLMSIKPSRLAAKEESKWKDYQVDSAGTRVKVYEDDQLATDIILGRFGVQGRQRYHTFVRLADDKEVYAANDFMSMSIPTDASGYRDNVLFRLNKDSIDQNFFNYPDFFVTLQATDDYSFINDQRSDSANTAKYLSGLNLVTSTKFYDDTENLNDPAFTVTIKQNNLPDINLLAYQYGTDWIIHTPNNPEGHFRDQSLYDRLFKRRSYFLGSE